MDEDEEYRQARRRVKSIKGFYLHLSIFVAVMILLLAINIGTGGPWWVQWPLLGWGIEESAAHAASVFGWVGWLGADWEERKIKEIMGKKPER